MRDRLLPIVTVHVALLWAIGAYFAAKEVGTANAARAIGALMTANLGTASAPAYANQRPMNALFGAMMASQTRTPEQLEQQREAGRQIATAEVIILMWKRTTWILAGLIDLLVLVAVLTGRIRAGHLAAAFMMLLGTLATLAAMRLLIRPDWGGMPPLPVASYLIAAAGQGGYALILLAAFARRPG